MEWGSYVEGAQCYVSKRRHAQQPYSVFTIDGHPFVVMWDTCCTVRGLIGETKARKLLAKQADSIKSVVWLDEPRPVGGVADGVAAYIVGEIVIIVDMLGRLVPLTFGILRNGNTGSADAMVGNLALRGDALDGNVARTVLR